MYHIDLNQIDNLDTLTVIGNELLKQNKLPSNVEYIGLLKRSQRTSAPVTYHDNGSVNYDLLVLLSGPEPQRTILENEIMKQLLLLKLKALVVRGVTEEQSVKKQDDFIEVVSNMTTNRLFKAMQHSATIICRAGYSTLMELISLQKKAVIIPTPGQTEQEYLAEKYSESNHFIMQKQSEINLRKALNDLGKISPLRITANKGFQKPLEKLIAETSYWN